MIPRELENGLKSSEICKQYNLSSFTVSILSKNNEKLMAAYDQNENFRKCVIKCDKEDLDEAFLKRMKVQNSAALPVNDLFLKV